MNKKNILLISFLFIIASPCFSQQIIDSTNVIYIDNTSDGNNGGAAGSNLGTFMNDPKYREFPQTVVAPGTADIYGWWSNTSIVYFGGNMRRASNYGSGNNTGAHAHFYCTVPVTDHYMVYHFMNTASVTTDAYVTFKRFGEGLVADSMRYNMLNNVITHDIMKDGRLIANQRGSWFPLGIIELFQSDSSLTVEIGLDSLGSNPFRVFGF